MRVNLARLVLSQSCSLFLSVVSFRLRIISLMLSLSAATSPRASTVMDRVRSPLVTAVATSAMARTCVVRLAASWFTVVGEVLPRARRARNARLAAELALDTYLARHGSHLIRECGER